MKRKTKIITTTILSSLIAINTGYLIYEAISTKENSLAYNLTHHSYPVNLKDNKVNEIKVDNLDGSYLVKEEAYPLNYTVYPLDAFDPTVTITSSDETKIKIEENSFKVLKAFEEASIKITSNENKEIFKEIKITGINKPIEKIEYDVSKNLEKQDSESNIIAYKVKQYEAFNVTFKGLSSDNSLSNEKITIETPNSITRIGSSNYYYINDSYSEESDCFIKAYVANTSITKIINLSKANNTQPEVSSYKFFKNEEEVSPTSLIKDETYLIKAYDSNNKELENLPFIINNNTLYDINYNLITFKEANSYNLSLNLFGVIKNINVKVSDVINDSFSLITNGDYKDNKEEIITTYLNRAFRYKYDKGTSTIDNFKLTKLDDSNNIITIKDGYIQANKVGEVKLEMSLKDLSAPSLKKTYTIKVLPLEDMWSINEIYIFGSIFCLTSILVTLLLFVLIDEKHTLFTLMTYFVGFILILMYTLISLVSSIRYPSVSLFFIYYLIYILGSSFTYIALHIYLIYKKRLKKKENN